MAYLLRRGVSEPFLLPYSLFRELIEANAELDNDSFKNDFMAVRLGRFGDEKTIKKVFAPKSNKRKTAEQVLMDFQKGVGDD